MKYEDIKKMGEAYAQIQEKQRQENAKRAEAMLKQEAKKLADQQEAMGDSRDDDDQVAQRKALQAKKKNEGAMKRGSDMDTYKKKPKDEDASNDKSDDGDGMDKVDKKAVKKKFDDRKDKDIDNDGDTDSSDEYLHKRRKAISKNSESKGKKEVEVQTQEKVKEDTVEEAASTGKGKNSDSVAQDKTDGMSPNAKKELARATNEPAVDAEKSNKLNFATFKKMTKKSKDN